MKDSKLKINITLNTIYQVVIIIIPLITAPYLSRVLGRDNIGIISYTNSIQVYFALFAALGTVSYGTRLISRNRDSKKSYSKLFWEIEILTIITSSVCLIAWFIFINITNQYRVFFLILSLNIVSVCFDISWLYAGLEKFMASISANLFFKTVQLIFIFVFIKNKNDVSKYVIIVAVTALLGNISMWLFLPKTVERVSPNEIKPFSHFKEIWIYFVPTIATTIYSTIDKTLIGVITKSEAENGYYEQATKIIHVAEAFTFNAVNSVLASRNAYLFKEKKHDEIKTQISNTMNYICFMSIGIGFGILGVADRFVPLFFGEGYEKVSLLLKYFMPIVLIIGISNCLGSQYYTPSGQRAKSAKFIICGAISNVILNIILIPILKSEGAVIASIFAELLISILYVANCDGFLKAKELFVQIYKKLISAIIMCLIIRILDGFIMNDILALTSEIILGILIYSALLYIFKDSSIKIIKNIFFRS